MNNKIDRQTLLIVPDSHHFKSFEPPTPEDVAEARARQEELERYYNSFYGRLELTYERWRSRIVCNLIGIIRKFSNTICSFLQDRYL